MAAEGLITLDELRTKLAGLEETRRIAEKELRALQGRKEYLKQLEHDRGALMEHYVNIAPEALNGLTLEERLQLYNLLRLRLTADEDRALTLTGAFGEVPSVQVGTSICVMPLLWNASSSSSGIREESPSTIPRTIEPSRGRRP